MHQSISMYLCLFMCVADNMEVFLTLAERQYIVKYELDGLRAQRDLRIPGLSDDYTLQNRDNICEYSHFGETHWKKYPPIEINRSFVFFQFVT